MPGVGKGIGWLGKAGKMAVRGVFEIGPKTHIVINGGNRFPDGLTPAILSEVKNVADIKFTSQLSDFLDYSKATGRQFHLYTRSNSNLAPALQDAMWAGHIEHRIIPGM